MCTASLAAATAALISASHVEVATVFPSVEFQQMGPPFKSVTFSCVDLLPWSPA